MPERRHQGLIYVYSRRGRTVATAALRSAGVAPRPSRLGFSASLSYYDYTPSTRVDDQGYGEKSAAYIYTNLTDAEIDVVLAAIALANDAGGMEVEPFLYG